MNFFKTMLASMLGAFIALGLILLVFVMIIVAAVSSASDEKQVTVKSNSVLHITLNQPFAERTGESDFNFNPSTFQNDTKMGLNKFLKALESAKEDDRIKGVFLEVASFVGAPSTLLDARNAIVDFRSSGKWVVAYAEDFSQAGYYMASAADEVYLYPTGSFDWRGINAEIMFFKKMLDKLEIEAQVIRGPNNKFKSAVEPFIYDHMSDENRAQMQTFVGDVWNVMLDGISKERKIDVAMLNSAADSLTFMDPKKALEAHAIDGLKYRDEVMDIMKGKIGDIASDDDQKDEDDKADKNEKVRMIDLADYKSRKAPKNIKPDQDKIAIVYAVGAIESGEGDDETIGSEHIAEALKKAREDDKVKAIVLRVNSPGGSALASDVIWRETDLIKQSGKPLVVSMGDYAASGGYYISCNANKIFANSNTITGSIGVFGILPNMQRFFDDKLGITFDRFETNPHADMTSASKPLDEAEMKAMQQMVSSIYTDFTSKVAAGRKMDIAMVDSIGQGRVWSGEDAKALGLVDEIGNLKDAVKAAADLAGISDYTLRELPTMIDPFEKLVEELTGQKKDAMLKEAMGSYYTSYQEIMTLSKMRGVQARMPFVIELK